jgi:serine/threonine-protein kinase
VSEPTDEAATETAPASPESATTEPGERSVQPKQHLGRYEIDSVLGVGGMGVVYAAFDPELERRVALKVLPDTRRGQSARERLLREARAMARLTDPNVVRVYEVDSVGGHDFVAMELVDGSTLTDWLNKTAHTPEEVVDRFVRGVRARSGARRGRGAS